MALQCARRCSTPLALALLLLAGCARGPATRPQAPVHTTLVRVGFTIQAGAFTQVENAARLAEGLQGQGLNAVYYAATPGLFRVRFGDFPTREAARQRAEALKAAGVIQDFYLAAPEEPTVTRQRPADDHGLRSNLVATGRTYLGVPYLWGGTTARGFDCSGLAMAVYRLNGLQLPRTSREQFEAGTPVPLERIRPGDLLFFAPGGRGTVSHVAIYAGNDSFIHAPGRGRRISLEQLSAGAFRETLVGARSYL
jgi:cell wall-associated NlpC family hydrolase